MMPTQKFRVSEIYRAVQGEGNWTGWPCTLVRFQGCNLRCPFCDTEQALDPNGGREVTGQELIAEICSIHRQGDIVLVTGGEPMMQDLGKLVAQLKPLGPVHLETNGTLPVTPGFDWVVLSPKGERISDSALRQANEVKWLVDSEEDILALQSFLAEWEFEGVVSVQPLSLSAQATQIAYQAALDHGWHLSLQTHKLIGRP
jgi:7-carboxy-7-deazaguanine synthase